MNEKSLKRLLSTIPIILIIICILAAFATQDWDLRSTLFPEDPQKTVESLLPLNPTAETEFLEFKDFVISEDGSKLLLELMLHSPLNVSMTIEELSAELAMENEIVIISLPGKVEVPANGSVSLKLEGGLPKAGMPMVPSEETLSFRNIKMKLDVEGMKLGVVM